MKSDVRCWRRRFAVLTSARENGHYTSSIRGQFSRSDGTGPQFRNRLDLLWRCLTYKMPV